MEVVALIRDIVIIFLGLMYIVLLAVLVFIAWKLYTLIKNNLPGLIDTAKDTATTVKDTATTVKDTATTVKDTATSVKGTADFIGEVAVTPLIRVAAFMAALTKFIQVLSGRGPRGT